MKKLLLTLALITGISASAQDVVEIYKDGKLVRKEYYNKSELEATNDVVVVKTGSPIVVQSNYSWWDKDVDSGIESWATYTVNGYGANLGINKWTKKGFVFGAYYGASASHYLYGNYKGIGGSSAGISLGAHKNNIFLTFTAGFGTDFYDSVGSLGINFGYKYKRITPQIRVETIGDQVFAGLGVGWLF